MEHIFITHMKRSSIIKNFFIKQIFITNKKYRKRHTNEKILFEWLDGPVGSLGVGGAGLGVRIQVEKNCCSCSCT